MSSNTPSIFPQQLQGLMGKQTKLYLFVYFRIDAVGEGFSGEACEEVVYRHLSHLAPGGLGGAGDVGGDDKVIQLQEGVIWGDWFWFGDIQSRGSDVVTFESRI